MKKIINQLRYLVRKVKEYNIDAHAAGCAYYTILAFIPIIMLTLTVIKYLGLDQKVVFLICEEKMSSNILNDAIINIVREVYSKSLGTITISVIFILWSAGKGFIGLCKGLSSTYEVEETNKFVRFRIRAIICTIIFILSVILTLLLLVFGNSINQILQERFNIFSNLINLLLKSKVILSVTILSIIFSIMYRFIPKHKYKFKNQIIGAIIASIACNIISIFYSVYVQIFTGFSLMYGSLTTIVLAMMWVYGCMYSILFGGVINKLMAEYVEKRK